MLGAEFESAGPGQQQQQGDLYMLPVVPAAHGLMTPVGDEGSGVLLGAAAASDDAAPVTRVSSRTMRGGHLMTPLEMTSTPAAVAATDVARRRFR